MEKNIKKIFLSDSEELLVINEKSGARVLISCEKDRLSITDIENVDLSLLDNTQDTAVSEQNSKSIKR